MKAACINCGQIFYTFPSRIKSGKGKYCSRECAYAARTAGADKVCRCCGKTFSTKYLSKTEGEKAKYCSKKCFYAAHAQVVVVCRQCRAEFSVDPSKIKQGKGKYCSRKCWYLSRRTQKDETLFARGCKQMKDWKKAVLARDGYKCAKCGAKNNGLAAHHIIPFSKDEALRYEVGNGITLCNECHKEIHLEMNLSEQYDIFFVKTNMGNNRERATK